MGSPLESYRHFQLRLGDLFGLIPYAAVITLALLAVPDSTWGHLRTRAFVSIGIVGAWRYTWWLMHCVRARVYSRHRFPQLRRASEALWSSGWRPRRVHYVITTFMERPETTEWVAASIVAECRSTGIPARLYLGSGLPADEEVMRSYLMRSARHLDIELVIVRQNRPGKRAALGLALRALSRAGLGPDEPVVLMDGDTMLGSGFLRRCLPLFEICPELDALTTAEESIVLGPGWLATWLEMRFAQRHLTMQSHALSNKVLTLTGRCSVFRSSEVMRDEFIHRVEADHFDDWLWGPTRFLSGDDKSTWYALLTKPTGTTMLYVPDALVCTVENIAGSGLARMRSNLLRWSGNAIRNSGRVAWLGPRRIGWFIWWCVIDQRLSMFTGLLGLAAAIMNLVWGDPGLTLIYVAWVVMTRQVLSVPLHAHAGRIRPSFPVFLYLNQLANSAIKFYLMFGPSRQQWLNRGGQKSATATVRGGRLRALVAAYVTVLWIVALAVGVALYTGVMRPPAWETILQAVRRG